MSAPRPRVFFLLGAARSGTTLLTRLLSAHPRIHLHHERRVLELAGVAGALLRTGGHEVDPHPAEADLARDLAYGRRYAEAVLQAGAPPGTVWFGDKYPPYSTQVSTLAAVWPEARFIHIVRDGRGVVGSWLHTWPRDHAWRRAARVPSVEKIGAAWARSVNQAHDAGVQLGPDRYHAFRYDDLLADPSRTGRRWLELLEEDNHPAFDAALAQVSRRGDWRRDLSEAETTAIESVPSVRSTLGAWGWRLEGRPGAPVDRAEDWVTRAESASDEDAARRAWLRVLRLEPGHPGAVSWLMRTQPLRGESLFALMNLKPGLSPDHRRLERELLEARGLSSAAASAVVGMDAG